MSGVQARNVVGLARRLLRPNLSSSQKPVQNTKRLSQRLRLYGSLFCSTETSEITLEHGQGIKWKVLLNSPEIFWLS